MSEESSRLFDVEAGSSETCDGAYHNKCVIKVLLRLKRGNFDTNLRSASMPRSKTLAETAGAQAKQHWHWHSTQATPVLNTSTVCSG